jgi:hypothetical protein
MGGQLMLVGVQRSWGGCERRGQSAQEICDQSGHLSLAQVHAALAYYHANRDAIDAELAEEEAEYDRLASAQQGGSGRDE